MSIRKIKKILLYFLSCILMLLLLGVLLINLPFARGFTTNVVNDIFDKKHLPVHIHSIGNIRPKAVSVNGVTIF